METTGRHLKLNWVCGVQSCVAQDFVCISISNVQDYSTMRTILFLPALDLFGPTVEETTACCFHCVCSLSPDNWLLLLRCFP